MARSSIRIIALGMMWLAAGAAAYAQSSLGIGVNDAITPSTGLFAGFLQWINVHQQQFYRALTGALRAMKDGGSGLWTLVGLSFAYGVFHAAGPGHGKAVISSYMLANEVALRRGVVLSFISAFLQGIAALVVIGALFLVLRGTSISMTRATWFLEVASFALIAAFGAWLLWQKLAPRLGLRLGMPRGEPRPASLSAGATSTLSPDACTHVRLNYRSPVERRAGVAEPQFCENCWRSHMPDPTLLSGKEFNWRSAWSAIIAVGIRPCTGALIVLSFAFLNGLWLGGVLSVLAMSLGTAITVSALAILAVTAKNWALIFAGDGRAGAAVHAIIEVGGALLVLILGLTMLAASLSA